LASLRAKDLNGAIAVFKELEQVGYDPKKDQILTFLENFLEHFRGHMQAEKAAKLVRALNSTNSLDIPLSQMKNIEEFIKSLEQAHVHISRNKNK
jgi:hypothetical protein